MSGLPGYGPKAANASRGYAGLSARYQNTEVWRLMQEVLAVHICKGIAQIARACQVSQHKIRDWIRQGAPIYKEGDVYYANPAEIWEWRKRHTFQNLSSMS